MDAIDLFGGNKGRIAIALGNKGYRAITFDIVKGGKFHDLSSKCGFEVLFHIALRLIFNAALVVLGPPCSMFIWLSSSQHLRHLFGPWGDS